MSYNGGVSYRGDKALAQQAMPEALKLANMVAGLKATAGLDRLEKVYDLEGGGTIRIVDFEHVKHIYIDVPPPPEEEEEVVEVIDETLEPSTYAITPIYNAKWAVPPAISDDAAGIEVAGYEDFTEYTVIDEATLGSSYFYSSFNQKEALSTAGWIGPDQLYLFTRFSSITNKYSMGYGDRNNGVIYHRGGDPLKTIGGAGFSEHLLGFGVFRDKLIWLESNFYTITAQEATAMNAFYYSVRVRSQDVTWSDDFKEISLVGGTERSVGSFTQDRTDYGIPIDTGFDIDTYLYVYDKAYYFNIEPLTFNPEANYNPRAGSLFFSFSPDGSKAVRARYFPLSNGTHRVFKEELEFSLDMSGDVQFTRTITDGENGAVFTYSGSDNTVDNSDPAPYPPGVGQPADGTEVEFVASDSTRTASSSYSISSAPLTLAYDYDVDNELVELQIEYVNASSSSSISETILQNETWTYETGIVPIATVTYWADITGTYAINGTFTESVNLSTNLIYKTITGSTPIPYYSADYSESRSYNSSASLTRREGGNVADIPTAYTGASGGGNSSGTLRDNFYSPNWYLTGISDMELRYGWFVTSMTSGVNSWGYTADVASSSDPGLEFTSKNNAVAFEREDLLHRVIDDALITTGLPASESTPTIGYTSGSISKTDHGNYIYGDAPNVSSFQFNGGLASAIVQSIGSAQSPVDYFPRYSSGKTYVIGATPISFPQKSSVWTHGLVRGYGGSLAINADNPDLLNGMFSVFGADLDWQRGNTLTETEFIDGSFTGNQPSSSPEQIIQLTRFPISQQALYHFRSDIDQVDEIADGLWPAAAYTFTNVSWNNGDDKGPFTWHEDMNSVGVVSLVDYLSALETL